MFFLVIRAKSKDGFIKVKQTFFKTDKKRGRSVLPYEIPEFCPCDEIYSGVASVMFSQKTYFERKKEGMTIVLDSGTTIAKWTGKKMSKIFKKLMKKMIRKCKSEEK